MSSLHNEEEEEEEEEDARTLQLGKAFRNAEVLPNAEVGLLLKQYLDIKRKKDTNFQINPTLKLAQEYANRFSTTKNPHVTQNVRELLLKYPLREFEVGAVANLAPETAEEARALIPSLLMEEDGLSDQDLEKLLTDFATLRQAE